MKHQVVISHHHHKHKGLDPLIRSVSRVTAARANPSSVFQLFSFLVVCSSMISRDSVLWHSLQVWKPVPSLFIYLQSEITILICILYKWQYSELWYPVVFCWYQIEWKYVYKYMARQCCIYNVLRVSAKNCMCRDVYISKNIKK